MANRAERRRAQRQANRSDGRVRTASGEVFEPEFERRPLQGKRRRSDPEPRHQPKGSPLGTGGRSPLPDGAPGAEGGARRREPRVGPPGGGHRTAVENLQLAQRYRTQAEWWAARRVAEARAAGVTWEVIGAALEVTGEAARKRYYVRAKGAAK